MPRVTIGDRAGIPPIVSLNPEPVFLTTSHLYQEAPWSTGMIGISSNLLITLDLQRPMASPRALGFYSGSQLAGLLFPH